MISSSKAKRLQKRAAKKAASSVTDEVDVATNGAAAPEAGNVSSITSSVGKMGVSDFEDNGQRTTTGVLTSNPLSRDIKIENFTLSCFGQELITNTTLELNFGRRIGLIGANGCGKSTFLKALANREVPIPEQIDIFLLNQEAEPSEMTAVEAVIEEVAKEHARLEKQVEEVSASPDIDTVQERLDDLYERLDALDPNTFESRACELLFGLGFRESMMKKKTKDLSGGWRMRVALARALFVKPTLLLLDEPTNHLDLEACVWLEEYLKRYNRILVVISHSQDFLNGVCTNIMYLSQKKLQYFGGNYNTFIKTKEENEVNQMKHYQKQQDEIEHIKKFIASCGTYANLVRQAKSRQKILDKMEADGLIEPVKRDPVFSFRFENCGKLPPPVLSFDEVSFSYSGKETDLLYKDLNLAIDLDSRVALVGPNGVGKSTLLKLICGDYFPTKGRITRHAKLRIGRYHQHSVEQLDFDLSPVEYFRKRFESMNLDIDSWRGKIGQFGITGKAQVQPIGYMSDGLRSRVVFCEMAIGLPNLRLLDEPTNHLDIECIDSLAEAINAFDGGVVLVSHDFRLINQVAKDILVCENKTIKKWDGTIEQYKAHLKKNVKISS